MFAGSNEEEGKLTAKEKLSALIDGELSPLEKQAMMDKLEEDNELQREWRRFYLIKKALQKKSKSY